MSEISSPAIDRPAAHWSEAALQAYRASLAGTLIRPEDDRYADARRIWNGMIDRSPALIARCASDDDVVASIRFAREHDIPFTVRGGGHNVAGSALCDGLVIDLTDMNGIYVDAARRRVRAQGGATIGALDRATQAYGLAAPMGVVTATGIGGLTLGGGLGWLRRKHGLSCDALRSVDVVTADGRRLRASATENEDLFWAVRGGGGNFGVVTSFEYELYDVGPDVFFLVVFYPYTEAADVLRAMRAFMENAPDAFSPLAVLAHVPPLDAIPGHRHGEPCLVLVGPYVGDVAAGERALAPLRTLGTPIADLSGPTPFVEVQQFFDADYPNGGRYYWKSTSLRGLEDGAIERLLARNAAAPSHHSTIDIWFHGGAMSRVDAAATAFGDRSAPVLIGIEANWHDADEDAANISWARGCFDDMAPFSDGRMYFNFPGFGDEHAAHLRATYGANHDRLRAIKRTYDPDNVFRTHQNIRP